MQSSTEPSRARAMALLSQGRLDLAEPHVREVLAGEPDDGWAHAVLVMCVGARREHKQAIAQADRAIAGSDTVYGWAFSIGLILLPLMVALAHDGRRRRRYLWVTGALGLSGILAALLSQPWPDRILASVILGATYYLGCIVLPMLRFVFREESHA